jgi:large subunit ribosomal protein L19
MERIREVEAGEMKKDVPQFAVGDTVEVHVKLVEEAVQAADAGRSRRGAASAAGGKAEAAGPRERIQVFTGTVIARRGSGVRETFTVRRLVQGEGVERVFLLHSPFVTDVKVARHGRVRRAKLYYLRSRVGKATRVRERRRSAGKGQ